MSNWNNVERTHGGASSQSSLEKAKGFDASATVSAVEKGEAKKLNVLSEEDSRLHRGLKSRHITMIAIGGAIGTGLIIGT